MSSCRFVWNGVWYLVFCLSLVDLYLNWNLFNFEIIFSKTTRRFLNIHLHLKFIIYLNSREIFFITFLITFIFFVDWHLLRSCTTGSQLYYNDYWIFILHFSWNFCRMRSPHHWNLRKNGSMLKFNLSFIIQMPHRQDIVFVIF